MNQSNDQEQKDDNSDDQSGNYHQPPNDEGTSQKKQELLAKTKLKQQLESNPSNLNNQQNQDQNQQDSLYQVAEQLEVQQNPDASSQIQELNQQYNQFDDTFVNNNEQSTRYISARQEIIQQNEEQNQQPSQQQIQENYYQHIEQQQDQNISNSLETQPNRILQQIILNQQNNILNQIQNLANNQGNSEPIQPNQQIFQNSNNNNTNNNNSNNKKKPLYEMVPDPGYPPSVSVNFNFPIFYDDILSYIFNIFNENNTRAFTFYMCDQQFGFRITQTQTYNQSIIELFVNQLYNFLKQLNQNLELKDLYDQTLTFEQKTILLN